MNTPVSFNIAKLLKVKGCDIECNYGYDFRSDNLQNFGRYIVSHMVYNAPTISEVIMWLYDKHGIWVWVSMELGYTNTFCWQLTGEHTSSNYKAFFKTPTDAYVDAITYTLNNLI